MRLNKFLFFVYLLLTVFSTLAQNELITWQSVYRYKLGTEEPDTNWNTFNIPTQVLMQSFGKTANNTGNFNFTSVLSSLGSNWNYAYYNINGSSSGWVLADRTDFAGSTLKYLNNTNDKPYFVNITAANTRFTL